MPNDRPRLVNGDGWSNGDSNEEPLATMLRLLEYLGLPSGPDASGVASEVKTMHDHCMSLLAFKLLHRQMVQGMVYSVHRLIEEKLPTNGVAGASDVERRGAARDARTHLLNMLAGIVTTGQQLYESGMSHSREGAANVEGFQLPDQVTVAPFVDPVDGRPLHRLDWPKEMGIIRDLSKWADLLSIGRTRNKTPNEILSVMNNMCWFHLWMDRYLLMDQRNRDDQVVVPGSEKSRMRVRLGIDMCRNLVKLELIRWQQPNRLEGESNELAKSIILGDGDIFTKARQLLETKIKEIKQNDCVTVEMSSLTYNGDRGGRGRAGVGTGRRGNPLPRNECTNVPNGCTPFEYMRNATLLSFSNLSYL